MTVKHKLTVAIEPGLLTKARAVAARRGRSVSTRPAEELLELVADDASYALARTRALALLATPLSLGGTPLTGQAHNPAGGLALDLTVATGRPRSGSSAPLIPEAY
jgi:hypothetical protein